MRRSIQLTLVAVLGIMAACHARTGRVVAPAAAPSPSGRSSTCVNGWTTPPPDSPLRREAVTYLLRGTELKAPLVVVAMRFFQGTDTSAATDKGFLRHVSRWYVKAYERNNPSARGRFLVARWKVGAGVAAVAPYDTTGFKSPDWTGFQYDSASPSPRPVPGLPGAWVGNPYDFVTGGDGLDFPGLPAELAGCLSGT
jgi:hypothetical protein